MTSPSSSCSFRSSSNFTVAVDVSTSVQCLQPLSPIYPIVTTPIHPISTTTFYPISPTTPINSVATTPIYPIATSPIYPISTTPINSVANTPMYPITTIQIYPISTTPINSVATTPIYPISTTPVNSIATTPVLLTAPPPPPPPPPPDTTLPDNAGAFSVVVPQERVLGPVAEQRHGAPTPSEDDVPYLRRKSKVHDSKRKRSREEPPSDNVKYGPISGHHEIRIQCEEKADAHEEPLTRQVSDNNGISGFLPLDSRLLVVTADSKGGNPGSISSSAGPRTSTSSFGGKASLEVGISPLVYDSTFSVDHRSVLEIPFDENNVPQIDRAATPPIFFRQSSLQVWPRSYTRRFASLRLQQRGPGPGGSSQLQVPAGSLRAGKASGKSRSITLGGGHSSSVRTRLDHGLRINAFVSTDRLHRTKESLLQNIGDDVSLYGTPKEDVTPFMSKSSTFGSPNFLREQIVSLFQPSDNKLAMKLFGNKHALMKEKMRQKAVGKWVIHPCSNFRSVSILL